MGCANESAINTGDSHYTSQSFKIKLYYSTESQPSKALKSFLDAGRFKYESQIVDMFKGENKSPEIVKMNPAGQVPFVVINDDVYLESSSVLRLLSQIMPSLSSYYPPDPFVR